MTITKKRKLTKEQFDILKAFIYDVWSQIGNTGEEERYPLITFNKKPLSKGYTEYDDEDWEFVNDFVRSFEESDGEYTITYEDDSDEDDDEDEEDD